MIDRDIVEQLRRMLRPVAERARNLITRGVVHRTDDGTATQRLQVGALPGEVIEGAEHMQPYGFASVPLDGSEVVAVFPAGDRTHALVIATSDPRHRPTGGPAGQVEIYTHRGQRVILRGDGPDIEIQPGPGGRVYVRDEGGTAEPLVRKSDYDGHTHAPGTLAAPSGGGPVTGVTGGAASVAGTQRLRSQ